VRKEFPVLRRWATAAIEAVRRRTLVALYGGKPLATRRYRLVTADRVRRGALVVDTDTIVSLRRLSSGLLYFSEKLRENTRRHSRRPGRAMKHLCFERYSVQNLQVRSDDGLCSCHSVRLRRQRVFTLRVLQGALA